MSSKKSKNKQKRSDSNRSTRSSSKGTIESVIQDPNKPTTLEELKSILITFSTNTKDSIKNLQDTLNERKQEYEELEDRITKLELNYESLEQHGRSNSLRFHNIPTEWINNRSSDAIIIDIVKNHLNLEITENDIDISHPLGPAKEGTRKRNIIVKFVRRSLRNRIYFLKKKMSPKNSDVVNLHKIFITEDLTKIRRDMIGRLWKLKNDKDIDSYWTKFGNIYVKLENDSSPKRLKVSDDLDDINEQLGLATSEDETEAE